MKLRLVIAGVAVVIANKDHILKDYTFQPIPKNS